MSKHIVLVKHCDLLRQQYKFESAGTRIKTNYRSALVLAHAFIFIER